MQCFKCLQNFNDPNVYFAHIIQVHDVCGKDRYKCTLCNEKFKEFGRFKKHVLTCFPKYNVLDETEQLRQDEFLGAFNDAEIEDESITVFKSKMRKSALHLVSKMSADMNTSRSLAFETISSVQEFMNGIIDGIYIMVMYKFE